MDSDRINRWLTLGANIGVLIGIVFLAVEIRQNRESLDQANKLSLIDARATEVEQYNEFRSLLAQDKELSDIWVRGQNGETLDAAEAERFGFLCSSNLWLSVTTWERSIELGRLATAEGTVNLRAQRIATRPGLRQCWESNKEIVRGYGLADYVSAVDAAIESFNR
jgi:hypothetical protein